MSPFASRIIFRLEAGEWKCVLMFFFSSLVDDHTFFRDGRYGLYLDESLFDGSSAWCVTFDNDPLCSPGPDKAGAVAFECVGLEVWAVGP